MFLQRFTTPLLFALALSVTGTASFATAQQKIAVVDLQRAMNETEDGRQAKKRLKKLFKKRQTTLDAAQKKLGKQKASIEKQKDVLSQEALQKKLESYQKTYLELQQKYVEFQKELATKEGELTQKILERMQQILKRIGQKESYTLIMEANEGGVIWVPSNLDLTDRVIQLYNAEKKKKK